MKENINWLLELMSTVKMKAKVYKIIIIIMIIKALEKQ